MEQVCWSLGRTLRSNLEEAEPQKLRGLSPAYPDESFAVQNSFEAFSRRPSFIRLNRRETPSRDSLSNLGEKSLVPRQLIVVSRSRFRVDFASRTKRRDAKSRIFHRNIPQSLFHCSQLFREERCLSIAHGVWNIAEGEAGCAPRLEAPMSHTFSPVAHIECSKRPHAEGAFGREYLPK